MTVNIDSETGEVFIPPPPQIKKAEAMESGGLKWAFDNPVIVPPFFRGKSKTERES